MIRERSLTCPAKERNQTRMMSCFQSFQAQAWIVDTSYSSYRVTGRRDQYINQCFSELDFDEQRFQITGHEQDPEIQHRNLILIL